MGFVRGQQGGDKRRSPHGTRTRPRQRFVFRRYEGEVLRFSVSHMCIAVISSTARRRERLRLPFRTADVMLTPLGPYYRFGDKLIVIGVRCMVLHSTVTKGLIDGRGLGRSSS